MELNLGLTHSQDTELLNDILTDDVSNEDYSKFEEALKQAREPEGLKSGLTDDDWLSDQIYVYNGQQYYTGTDVLIAPETFMKVEDVGSRLRDCYKTVTEINANAGYENYGSAKVYQLAIEYINESKMKYNDEQIEKAIEVIIGHLDESMPIVVGVHYEWNEQWFNDNRSNTPYNNDWSTDHFIIITEMKFDSEAGKYFFNYQEPGTQFDWKGTTEKNRLYIERDDDGHLRLLGSKDNPNNIAQKGFIVTNVRPNKQYSGDISNTINQTVKYKKNESKIDCELSVCE